MENEYGNKLVEISKEKGLFTWSKQSEVDTIAIEKVDGCYFYDYDGKKYFDLGSQLVNVNIGFGNEKVINAICDQARKMAYVGPSFVTDVRAKLTEKIISEFSR
ncbi:Ornithine aminotransferase [bioreactor metagenome]|uniref:Ornithine aminotransferase n=1 Tax=bioreactor metagenome TaxID=1076179 RepID=A0A644ZNP8_9ZZZZ|nr:aminotransferase class III-fold pyridoxal phosphate-dependent enzyme [Candidatus Metalachnospira sp.]